MRDEKIWLSLVNFIDIMECKVTKKVNEHGSAVISGHIKDTDEAGLLQDTGEIRFATVYFRDESEENQVLFSGMVESIAVKTEAGVKKATVTLTGGTRLLALKERTRTFQNASMTYEGVIKKLAGSYSDFHYITGSNGQAAINGFLVQYKETDWDFLKRIASHSGAPIIPHFKSPGIRFYIGAFKTGKTTVINPVTYSVENGIDEYFYKKKNGVELANKEDACYYCFESREFYDLGDGLSFQNKNLFVYQAESELRGSELIHSYRLKTTGGFKEQKRYNTKLIGASLDASILSVSKDKVKVCIQADGSQDSGTARWFPYSTVYSSPDGSGWYCMPEENDRVRLYFPNEKEGEAYVVSSIHVESTGAGTGGGAGAGGGEAPRSNPDNKSIQNKYNKKVELTPTTILLTNNDGMTIKLDDEEGISIISKKDILIQSEENLEILSMQESMTMEAAESLELIQGDTKITLKDDIVVEGAMLKVQ